MPKKNRKPSFVIELPLAVNPADERKLMARFEAARRLYNAVLGEALATLQRMRESKQWQAARAMPTGKPDSPEREARSAAFNACIERFGFTAYQFGSLAVAHKNAAGFLEPVHNLRSNSAKNTKCTNCRLVLSLRSAFFHSRRHFSSSAAFSGRWIKWTP